MSAGSSTSLIFPMIRVIIILQQKVNDLPVISFYCSPKQTQQLNELAVVLAKSDWSKSRHPVLRMECCCLKEFILI